VDRRRFHGAACYKDLAQRYKFILSFENSICKDYVTEKMYEAMRYNWVPIVRGGADYNTLTPEHSVIDASNRTPAELAKIIRALDDDKNEYLRYFQWKKTTVSIALYSPDTCKLCEQLRNAINGMTKTTIHQKGINSLGPGNGISVNAGGGFPKTYANLADWWYTQSNCVIGYFKV
jgi:hypothetical protein